jgi:cytochrome c oxidase cbb3-type subunit 2
MKSPPRSRPTRSRETRFKPIVAASVVAIAAAYLYFLLFGDFVLLAWSQTVAPPERLPVIFTTFGVGGVLGSVTLAFFSRPDRVRWLLVGGFVTCAVSDFTLLAVHNEGATILVATLAGIGLGWTTTALSLCLRPSVHSKSLGLWCGLGTGIAYAICNQPLLFEATARTQAIAAAAAAALGAAASLKLRSEPVKTSSSTDYSPRVLPLWIAVFLALVALDTVCFYLIQHSPALREQSWEGALVLEGNAFLHLCIAALAGLSLDRRVPVATTGLAVLLLLASGLALNHSARSFSQARVLYVAAVSIYSTALVYFPARSGRPGVVSAFLAIAGWGGSAAGLILALHAPGVPPALMIVVGLIVGAAFLLRYFFLRKRALEEEE